MNGTVRLARAELRKLFTTRALPVSFAIAIVLAIGSVIIDAMVAGKNGSPRLGTDAAVYGSCPSSATIGPKVGT
jgi:hypothetical protein